MSENKLQSRILKNFGPSVLHVKIPKKIVDTINVYIDGLVNDKIKSKSLNIGEHLVGDVTQEFSLEDEFIKKSGWYVFFGIMCKKVDRI